MLIGLILFITVTFHSARMFLFRSLHEDMKIIKQDICLLLEKVNDQVLHIVPKNGEKNIQPAINKNIEVRTSTIYVSGKVLNSRERISFELSSDAWAELQELKCWKKVKKFIKITR